eukprot:11055508-Alexandrium_andersonii.AAC.1
MIATSALAQNAVKQHALAKCKAPRFSRTLSAFPVLSVDRWINRSVKCRAGQIFHKSGLWPGAPMQQSMLLPEPIQDLAECLERRALDSITAGQALLAIHAGELAVVAAVVGVDAVEAVLVVILGELRADSRRHQLAQELVHQRSSQGPVVVSCRVHWPARG